VTYRYEKSGKRVLMPVASKEILSNHPDGRFPLTIHMKNINAYYIKTTTKENIERLFHYFYNGVDKSMYLTRKYNVFVKGSKLEEKNETEQLTLDLDF
jgi:CO dehydrogenase/acetyl-CoA synthase beta subunit